VGILRKIAYTRIKENSWKTKRKPRLEINLWIPIKYNKKI
jgi:hypothetical protein